MDRDGGGTVSLDEFLELLHSIAVKPTPHEIALLFNEIDDNHNGVVEIDEFMDFMQDTAIKQMKREDLVQAFQVHPPSHASPHPLTSSTRSSLGLCRVSEVGWILTDLPVSHWSACLRAMCVCVCDAREAV